MGSSDEEEGEEDEESKVEEPASMEEELLDFHKKQKEARFKALEKHEKKGGSADDI